MARGHTTNFFTKKKKEKTSNKYLLILSIHSGRLSHYFVH
jgi:hypothetical protein